eukprot:PITA_07073
MVHEMSSLYKNEALDLVDFPPGRKPIGRKRVFKKKMNAEGKGDKYKAHLVAKGYSQVEQMDMKTTLLHGFLEEEIYMKQTEGFAVKGEKEQDLKTQLSSKFDMKDLGVANYILGMEIKQNRCPKKQEEEEDMSHVPYASEFDSLLYRMIFTRPNIAHAMGVLSRFMSKPKKEHWTTVEQVFRYFHRTSDYGLFYQGRLGLDKVLDIHGFVDVEWVGDLDQRISTSGYVFNIFGGAMSWMSKIQSLYFQL